MPMPRRVWRPCAVEECEGEARAKGWCYMHYSRWYRHGNPLTCMTNPPGHQWLASSGYMKTIDRSHPMASPKNGEVYVHRRALYDKLGPGAFPCWFCTRSVRWDRTYPRHADGLTVEHIDRDKLNNDPANLAPCCGHCNLQQGRIAHQREALA